MQSPYIIAENGSYTLLNKAVEAGKMHHAYLLSGPDGAGKTAMALHFAHKLLCRSEGVRPCFACASCRKIAAYCHPDFRIVFPFVSQDAFKKVVKELDLKSRHAQNGEEPSAEELYYRYLSDCAKDLLAHPFHRPRLSAEFEDKNREITIQQVREIIEDAQMPPSESQYKVILLTDVDKMDAAPANAFLKTLEEPPPFVKFLLITSRPKFLLPTIRSRCQEIKFNGLSKPEIITFLKERAEASDSSAHLAARFSLGSLPNALEFLDHDNASLMEEALDIITWMADKNPSQGLEMASRFSEGSWLAATRRLKLTALLLHEIGNLKNSGEEADSDEPVLKRLKELSGRIPEDAFLSTYDKITQTSNALERKGNPSLVHAAFFLSLLPAGR